MNFEHPRFLNLDEITDGSSGWIGKAFDKTTEKDVAIKAHLELNFNIRKALTALREIQFMSALKHQNVMSLQHVIGARPKSRRAYLSSIYILMELMHTDMYSYVETLTEDLEVDVIQKWMFQMLSGLYYIHSAGVMHRDLKPDNILLSQSLDTLKICDFERAQLYNDRNLSDLTENVTAAAYKAPEMTLKPGKYSNEIDTWGIGCIFYFMFTRSDLITTPTLKNIPTEILSVIGTPSRYDLRDINDRELIEEILQLPFQPKVNWRTKLPECAPDSAVELLGEMMHFCALDRISLDNALRHEFLLEQRTEGWKPEVYTGQPLHHYTESMSASEIMKILRSCITLDMPKTVVGQRAD